jgi:hypothetical protein
VRIVSIDVDKEVFAATMLSSIDVVVKLLRSLVAVVELVVDVLFKCSPQV